MKIGKNLIIKILLIAIIAIGLGIVIYFYFPKIFGDLIFPLEYEGHIIKYSREYEIDPSLIAAIIYAESRYYSGAASHAGAQGLMQIMPATGKAIASRIGESFGDLLDPETNIRYGTYYIKSLMDKYNGDIEAALAAYNGGAGVADRYVITRSDASIPVETAGYLKKVISAKSNYEKIHGHILNAQNVAEALKIKQEQEQKTWIQKLIESFKLKF